MGYTQVSNELYERLLGLPCGAAKLGFFVVRKTAGWNKAEDAISYSQMREGTGMGYGNISRALQQLELAGLVEVTRASRRILQVRLTTTDSVVTATSSVVNTTDSVASATDSVVETTTDSVETKDSSTAGNSPVRNSRITKPGEWVTAIRQRWPSSLPPRLSDEDWGLLNALWKDADEAGIAPEEIMAEVRPGIQPQHALRLLRYIFNRMRPRLDDTRGADPWRTNILH